MCENNKSEVPGDARESLLERTTERSALKAESRDRGPLRRLNVTRARHRQAVASSIRRARNCGPVCPRGLICRNAHLADWDKLRPPKGHKQFDVVVPN